MNIAVIVLLCVLICFIGCVAFVNLQIHGAIIELENQPKQNEIDLISDPFSDVATYPKSMPEESTKAGLTD